MLKTFPFFATSGSIGTVGFTAVDGKVYLPALLQESFGNSGSHWRRQIDQGGVKLDGIPAAGYEVAAAVLDGATVQAGKRQYVRFRAG